MRHLLPLSLLAFGATTAFGAVTFDSDLTSPPGVYYGSGNSNGNFTVSTDATSGTELGLRAIIRFVGAIDPGNSNTYDAPAGTYPNGRPFWGFDMSVNTQALGGSNVLADFTYLLSITDITTSTNGASFDWVNGIPDNSGYGPGGVTHNPPTPLDTTTQWGAQNSENLGFTGYFPGFNPNATDLYQITISQFTLANTLVQADSIMVQVVSPEPGTAALMGGGLIGLLAVARRRMRRS